MPHETVIPDGSFDFAGGVDSQVVTTVRSTLVPHGLRRDQVSWLDNATVRGGGILQRMGFINLVKVLTSGGLFQGGFLYEPWDDTHPYLILAVSGHIYKVFLDPPFAVTDLSVQFGLFHPANQPQFYFVQGEGFLIIQAGDGVTLPLFYTAAFTNNNQPETLRRSRGIISANNIPGGVSPFNELPSATAMVYYGDRIWYAQGRKWTAGDIVDNQSSGTPAYAFNDSILKVTENPLAAGGDGFVVPSQAGNIRALAYTANVDTTLGQGPLYIFTRKQVYSMVLPATRAAWIAATNTNQPLVTVSQINNGTVGDRSVVHINGDLFYQSFDPQVRSLIVATRFYQQWGNIGISNNVNRALQFNNRALMRFASAIQFDNRLMEGVLPQQTPSGVVCTGILPLDFDLVSSLQDQAPPAWEGIWEGIDIFQMWAGDFGGLPRAFALVLSRVDQSFEVWEFQPAARFDNANTPTTLENRVNWFIEFPAFTWGKEFEMKDLQGGMLFVDKLFGTVNMEVYWRPDADPCWKFWFRTSFCAAHNCAEDVLNPVCYPIGPQFREGYRFPIVFPKPLVNCDSMSIRPANLGFQHQVKVVVKGWMRIRGIILYSEIKEFGIYEGLNCGEIILTPLGANAINPI